jgi:hypothetical protein
MPSETKKIETIAEKLGYKSEIRTLNLSAYNMKLKLAIYMDGALNIIEGGHHNPSKMTEIGFHLIEGEWVSMGAINPGKIAPIFDQASVERRPFHEILIDRTDRKMPESANDIPMTHKDRVHANSINATVAKAVADASGAKLTEAPAVWFANADFEGYDVQGFGSTPDEAMKALIDTWSDVVARDWANVEDLVNNRDIITVSRVELGKGLCTVLLDGKEHSMNMGYRGDDSMFDDIISQMLPTKTNNVSPKP